MKVDSFDLSTNDYETRICLFLDLLGFANRVTKGVDDPTEVGKITAAIDVIRSHFIDPEIDGNSTKKVTQFSDSVVVSYAANETSAVFDLLHDTGLCLMRLAERGFLMRGGVALGPLIHTDTHLFGPAMNAAYYLESKTANYPRVIVQDQLLLVATHAHAKHHSAEDELKYVSDLLRRDLDGLMYLDYISWDSVIGVFGGENDLYPQYLAKLAKLILLHSNDKDLTIRAKYGWVARHYMQTKNGLESLPKSHAFRLENPGYVEEIAALPTFKVSGDCGDGPR